MSATQGKGGSAWSHRHPWLLMTLAPLLLVQALHTRRVTPRLPEPAGERVGRTGEGRPLRLLITGDSAAAGVGVSSQTQALSGQLSHRLAADFTLHWQLEATTGHTASDAIARLQHLPVQPFDVAVVSLGVNDVTAGIGAQHWVTRLRELSTLLAERFQVRQVIFSPVPPMHLFPALPQPLRGYLGSRARHFNEALARQVGDMPGATLLQVDLTGLTTASDGFHPGPEAYAAWAEALNGCIRAQLV